MTEKNKEKQRKRPPVVTVVGHIDHGKSTLLDQIRRSNTTEKEAGGITQHISAYEVEHTTQGGEERKITFLDTPGHEAFKAQRSRGVNIADLAILIIAADDGVKEQTKEALNSVRESGIPFIIAINKIDKEGANIEKVKQELMENEIFLEGYGGQTSHVPISAKSGEGIPELLEMVILAADLEELQGTPEKMAEGVVLESDIDPKKGIAATLIIKDGTLRKGMYVVARASYAPVRIMEDFTGSSIEEATFSSPVKIIGFSGIPEVGAPFYSYRKKKEAEKQAEETAQKESVSNQPISREASAFNDEEKVAIPIILKADVTGSLRSVEEQLKNMSASIEDIEIKFPQKGLGDVSESDVRFAAGTENSIVVGFNVSVNTKARELAEEKGVEVKTFNIIYELMDWIEEMMAKRKPRKEIEEIVGKIKIKKVFAQTRDSQVLGGVVQEGYIQKSQEVKIHRRNLELGKGVVVNLQQQKVDTDQVKAENECGLQVRSKTEISAGDILEGFIKVEK